MEHPTPLPIRATRTICHVCRARHPRLPLFMAFFFNEISQHSTNSHVCTRTRDARYSGNGTTTSTVCTVASVQALLATYVTPRDTTNTCDAVYTQSFAGNATWDYLVNCHCFLLFPLSIATQSLACLPYAGADQTIASAWSECSTIGGNGVVPPAPNSCHEIACGSGIATQCTANYGTTNGVARCAPDAELHEVRCCSDVPVANWSVMAGCSAWSESDAWTEGCQVLNWPTAAAFCHHQGARSLAFVCLFNKFIPPPPPPPHTHSHTHTHIHPPTSTHPPTHPHPHKQAPAQACSSTHMSHSTLVNAFVTLFSRTASPIPFTATIQAGASARRQRLIRGAQEARAAVTTPISSGQLQARHPTLQRGDPCAPLREARARAMDLSSTALARRGQPHRRRLAPLGATTVCLVTRW
jgi:hypothetical protein